MKLPIGELKVAVRGRNCQGAYGDSHYVQPGETYYELPFGNLGTPVCKKCLERLASSASTALRESKKANAKVICTEYACKVCTTDKDWPKFHSLETKLGLKHIDDVKNHKELVRLLRAAKAKGVKLVK